MIFTVNKEWDLELVFLFIAWFIQWGRLYTGYIYKIYLFQVQWNTVNAFVGTGQWLAPIPKLTSITGHRYSINDDDDSGDGDDVDDDKDTNYSVDDIEALPVQRLLVMLHSLATIAVNFEFDAAIEVEQRYTAQWPCQQSVNKTKYARHRWIAKIQRSQVF